MGIPRLFCSKDPVLLARWREADSHASESAPKQLESSLSRRPASLCLIDTEAIEPGRLPELIRSNASARIVAMAARPRIEEGVALLQAGARGYANRYMDPAILKVAIETVQNGEIWAGAEVISYLLRHQIPAQVTPAAAHQLSERELEVAQLVQAGLSNKGIAQRLGITERTVKSHLNAAYGKTGSKSRLQLALWLGTQESARARA